MLDRVVTDRPEIERLPHGTVDMVHLEGLEEPQDLDVLALARLAQSLTLGIVKLGGVARRLAVDQPGRPPGVESQNPVADRRQTNFAERRLFLNV